MPKLRGCWFSRGSFGGVRGECANLGGLERLLSSVFFALDKGRVLEEEPAISVTFLKERPAWSFVVGAHTLDKIAGVVEGTPIVMLANRAGSIMSDPPCP
jgi:hypothetical protein